MQATVRPAPPPPPVAGRRTARAHARRPLLLALLLLAAAGRARGAAAAAAAGAEFWAAALAGHNQKRQAHNAAPLQWDDGLSSFAKGVAEKCAWRHTHGAYGENFYMRGGGGSAPDQLAWSAVGGWSSEASQWPQYRGRDDVDLAAVGHFTQIVWKGTRKVGCAHNDCSRGIEGLGQGGSFVVCAYEPRGNWRGQFADNVEA